MFKGIQALFYFDTFHLEAEWEGRMSHRSLV